jgi:ATP-dependent exoDNAse (exonuclease V) alpha subunit
MLERHLVYTGFSRAKQLLVIIGSKQAMLRAVQYEAATKRQTMLKEMLAAN